MFLLPVLLAMAMPYVECWRFHSSVALRALIESLRTFEALMATATIPSLTLRVGGR